MSNLIPKIAETAKTLAETIRILMSENPAKKDEVTYDQRFKEKILRDETLNEKEKMLLIYGYEKIKREYRNSKNILETANKYFGTSRSSFVNRLNSLDDDWFSFFIEKAEKTSNERVQRFWARLLAQKLSENEKDEGCECE